MKNYNEQLNEIRNNVIQDVKELKNKIFFNGELADLWEVSFELPQTNILNRYGWQIACFVTELTEVNKELKVKAIDNENAEEQIFDIYDLPTETLIDILYFEPIENNQ